MTIRRSLARVLYRLAFRVGEGRPDPRFTCPVHHLQTDVWTYPVSFTGPYRRMALEGFVGITRLVLMEDGRWTLLVEQIDISSFARMPRGSE